MKFAVKFLTLMLLCGAAFGQAFLQPQPKFRALDSNGVPLAGGKLYSYTAGTTTPLSTYTDSTGGVANTNPVILDANGEANVWFGSASYKIILKSSTDVQQWSVDNINAAVTGTGSLMRATAPTVTNIVLNTGISANGTGYKHKRVSTGSVGAGVTIGVNIAWGGTVFADTNYTAQCSIYESSAASNAASLRMLRVNTRTTTSLNVTITNDTGGALTGELWCSAVHD